jgi:hypothetical protein
VLVYQALLATPETGETRRDAHKRIRMIAVGHHESLPVCNLVCAALAMRRPVIS